MVQLQRKETIPTRLSWMAFTPGLRQRLRKWTLDRVSRDVLKLSHRTGHPKMLLLLP